MKSTNTFGVQFIARSGTSASGLLSIYVRITVNKKRLEISLKKTVDPQLWDAKARRVRGTKEETRKLNNYIGDVRFKLMECYRELQLAHKPITPESIKALFLGEETAAHTVCSLMQYHNVNLKEVLAPGTLKNYFTTEKYVKLFLKNKQGKADMYLSELNNQFITEFEFFLRRHAPLQVNRPLSNNGLMKHMERFRKMVTLATKLEWIPKDPFVQYSLRFQKVDKPFLSTLKLATVEETKLSVHKLNLARDLFVFSCYTGLSYIDLMHLTPCHISLGEDGEYWIKTARRKTDTRVHVPLLPKAKVLVDKYCNDPRAVTRGAAFPYLCNQKINAYLKEIARICTIRKDVSFHMARHTFATTVTLTNGVPLKR